MTRRGIDIPRKLVAMQKMTAGDLRAKYAELFGEPSRSGNLRAAPAGPGFRASEDAHSAVA